MTIWRAVKLSILDVMLMTEARPLSKRWGVARLVSSNGAETLKWNDSSRAWRVVEVGGRHGTAGVVDQNVEVAVLGDGSAHDPRRVRHVG